MGSAFDNMQSKVFDITKTVFGYLATWQAIDGGASFDGLVHFKNPTVSDSVLGADFDPFNWQMEYKKGDFDGLKERVDSAQTPEIVTIDGSKFIVNQVVALHDGKTFRAALTPVNDDIL